MNRKDFLKMCGILGIGMPVFGTTSGCGKDGLPVNKVVIIGAGAGGLSAGYLLAQRGIDFEILEASSTYGGRMKINTDFADFPIPLGSEWIETGLGIFDEIVNDGSVEVEFDTIQDDTDKKFVNYSWFQFFEDYVVPSVLPKIQFNTVVETIDYQENQVTVTTQSGQHTADRVVVSVPLQILKNGGINFVPQLPQNKRSAIESVRVWEGFKAFFEFTDKFYQDQQFPVSPPTDGEKWFYDATYGQNSTKNILGVFAVGTPAIDYITRSGNDLRDLILTELDALYSGQATLKYVNHIVQNWNDEPFIQGGYLSDHADWNKVARLGKSVDDKVYFAGGPYTDGEDWVSVHAAARSARVAIDEMAA
ncbi:MAG: FAD-dependent oxidoreductase [Flavobacteriales bacterium]|nr:FAD-dependent oxidoreductase [Flavobacteriales bacterium]